VVNKTFKKFLYTSHFSKIPSENHIFATFLIDYLQCLTNVGRQAYGLPYTKSYTAGSNASLNIIIKTEAKRTYLVAAILSKVLCLFAK